MRRVISQPTCGSVRASRIDILWEKGEAFEISPKPKSNRQPRTLIMYFPALVLNQHSATHQPTASSF
jgi:hypothetical protein